MNITLTEEEKHYIYTEIIEQGTLNFVYEWLNEKFEWTIVSFSECMIQLFYEGLAEFYTYDKNNEIVNLFNVRLDDFRNTENLKRLNFSPTSKTFSVYRDLNIKNN